MSLCDMVAFRAALIPAEWAVGFSGRWLANLEDKFAATVHAVVRSFTSAGRVDGHRAGPASVHRIGRQPREPGQAFTVVGRWPARSATG
jgi:hypothetical protein